MKEFTFYALYSGSFRDSAKAPSTSSAPAVITFGSSVARSSDSRKNGLTLRNQSHRNNFHKDSIVETLQITRLAGENLGLGLKFEGGSRASECVQRLFVQGW